MILLAIISAPGCKSDGFGGSWIPAGHRFAAPADPTAVDAAQAAAAESQRAADHAALVARAQAAVAQPSAAVAPVPAEVARVSHTAPAVQAADPAAGPVAVAAAGPAWIVAQSDPLVGDTPGNAGDGAAITEAAGAAAEPAADTVLPPPPIGSDGRVADSESTQPVEELPAPIETQLLDLETVLISATESFPSVRQAAQLRAEALGESQRALGEFDDRLEAFTINQPMGFYQNYRHGISWSRPLENGGVAYTGYRIGRGRFEPWYGGRDTDDSGEFRVGFEIPLLQNRAIDPRRTAVRLAALDIQRASPELFQQVLGAQVEAAEAYWQWVAAGQRYEIAEELMMLAEERVERIQRQIDAEDIARIVGVDNRRLLAQRRSLLIEARRAWDAAAVRLSLYYRNAAGVPISVADAALPEVFPEAPSPPVNLEIDITEAMDLRPELAILRIAGEQLRTELRLAINQQLPEVGFSTEASKDVGPLTSPTGDKRPFVLETGLIGTVPVQRNRALGRARSLRARLAQLDARTQLTADQIANEVRQATIAYQAARQRLQQATLGQELARQTLRFGEIAFQAGEIDILLLNIYEQAYADAGQEVIDAQAAMHIALARRLTARGEMLLDESLGPPGIGPIKHH